MVPMDRRPGRIGFMSTQRRENRSVQATAICRVGFRCRWRTGSRHREGAVGRLSPAPVTRYGQAHANGLTAQPQASVVFATDSLHKDRHIVRLVRQDVCSGTKPLWKCRSTQAGPPAAHRYPRSLLSLLSGNAPLHVTLPQAPAGRRRWAERYDGKRDLYFKHAA
jgi:hypothetical protein